MSHYIEKVTVSLENLILRIGKKSIFVLKNQILIFQETAKLILRHVLALP